MNKKIYFLLLLLISVSYVNAQDNPQASASSEHENILKINLSSLLFTNIYLQDEYKISTRSTVALGVAFLPTRGLPSAATKDNSDLKDLEFGGFSITPEYRYYFSGKAPKGFYMAPYLRYANYSTNSFRYIYDTDSGSKDTVGLDKASYTATTFGIMFGAQWKLGKHVALDFWIVGVGFGSCAFEAKGTGNFSTTDQSDFKKSIDDIKMPYGDLSGSMTSNTANVKYSSSIGGRGLGFCIGYIF